jgi:hypothetical protein
MSKRTTAGTGLFSKLLNSLTGVGVADGDMAAAESSTAVEQLPTNETKLYLPAAVEEEKQDDNHHHGGLPSKRRKTVIEERKREEEKKRTIEANINEWKRSIRIGYEFDPLEIWPYTERESLCTLPENHPSTKAMYV